MSTLSAQILRELEDASQATGLALSTIGRMVGQGGGFPLRLRQGKRIWPETAEAVRRELANLYARERAGRGDAA